MDGSSHCKGEVNRFCRRTGNGTVRTLGGEEARLACSGRGDSDGTTATFSAAEGRSARAAAKPRQACARSVSPCALSRLASASRRAPSRRMCSKEENVYMGAASVLIVYACFTPSNMTGSAWPSFGGANSRRHCLSVVRARSSGVGGSGPTHGALPGLLPLWSCRGPRPELSAGAVANAKPSVTFPVISARCGGSLSSFKRHDPTGSWTYPSCSLYQGSSCTEYWLYSFSGNLKFAILCSTRSSLR
mmetsp:Transcript_2015/g.4851  ORF Transcript_2015/g.4851 Transcript_2015/m.4851 type:complete len:246 (-) Transcript_2015:1114-1851(-)